MRTAIVSPSGKFYGSEQTLFSYLKHTKNIFTVFVKYETNGLYQKLRDSSNHKVNAFNNTYFLYFRLFILLVFRYDRLYINEAGHIRYIKTIAKLFKKKSFIIHVRLTEDTKRERLHSIPKNVKLIAVSEYISRLIFDEIGIRTQVLSSPERGGIDTDDKKWNLFSQNQDIKIGIIGRLSKSKGVKEMSDIILSSKDDKMTFHFFGDFQYSDYEVVKFTEELKNSDKLNYVFHGFISEKNNIYESVDIILHFNKNEPLGVIFFESLNYKKPIIGFNSGGIGEIAKKLGLSKYMINNWDKNSDLRKLIKSINLNDYEKARKSMIETYSISNYSDILESIII